MADKKKHVARMGAEAMLDAGKDAARKLYDDLTLSDEEKAQKEAEREAEAKKKRFKWYAIGIGALLAIIIVMVLLAKFWFWIIALAIGAALAFGGYLYLKSMLAGKGSKGGEDVEVRVDKKREAPQVEKRVRVEVEEDVQSIAEREQLAAEREAAAAERQAQAAAKAVERERKIDDELAELKRKARG